MADGHRRCGVIEMKFIARNLIKVYLLIASVIKCICVSKFIREILLSGLSVLVFYATSTLLADWFHITELAILYPEWVILSL